MPTLNPLLLNVKNQAQNLARIQNIQLCEAYEIISWAFYHCPNYQDLRKRFTDPYTKSRWFELAKIDSSSNRGMLEKLKKVLPVLIDRLSSRILCNTNRLGLTEQIFQIFGLPNQDDSFNSLFLNASINSSWNVVIHGENSSFTVLENNVKINNICYRLLAINVFMPSNWPLKEQEHFDIAEEISPCIASEFQLNISEPAALQKAVYSYIQARLEDPEDDFIEFCYPSPKLSKSEMRFEEDIQKLLKISGLDDWSEHDDQPIPLSFNGAIMLSNTYLVFGYPVADNESLLNNSWVMGPDKCPINDSQIFLLNDMPMSLEWISVDPDTLKHNGDYVEHFKSIYSLCSQQKSFVPMLEKQQGFSQLLVIKPASHTQIRRDLELKPHVNEGNETWFVKVENSVLAEEVIKKVCSDDLFLYENKYGTQEIICKIVGTWKSPPNLSISLDILSSRSERLTHLTTGMSSQTREDTTTIFITISGCFINALKVIDKDKLIKSMKNGLVHHIEIGTFSNLDDSLDDFMENLPRLPKHESQMLTSFELPDDFLANPLRFFMHMRQKQYEKQSF
jgi:hypothetical protein